MPAYNKCLILIKKHASYLHIINMSPFSQCLLITHNKHGILMANMINVFYLCVKVFLVSSIMNAITENQM